jgi:hypothetical protein
MGRYAADHEARRLAQPVARPVLPHQIVVGADTARSDEYGAGSKIEIARSLAPFSTTRPSTRWRKRKESAPEARIAMARAMKGARTPGPVPQVT